MIKVYDLAEDDIKAYRSYLWRKSKNTKLYEDIYSRSQPASYLCDLGEWVDEFLEMIHCFFHFSGNDFQKNGNYFQKNGSFSLWFPFSHSSKIELDQICRNSILKYKKELSIELQNSLPAFKDTSQMETPNASKIVRAILPVLVSGYIQNRRGDPDWSKEKAGYPRQTANVFVNLINHDDPDGYHQASKNIKSLFMPNEWDSKYPKLTYVQITPQKMRPTLTFFGDVMLFLFLVYKMKNFCNLSLSCTLFEATIGDIGFFDKNFPRIEKDRVLGGPGDDPIKDEIISYLDKMFNSEISPGQRASLWNEALARYVVFVIDHVVFREEKAYNGIFSDYEWGKNKWAAELMSCFPVQSWLGVYCSHGNGIVDDSLYQEIKMAKLFQKKSYKRRLKKLISIRYSKKIMCLGESKRSAKYRIKPVGDMSERDATGKWIREEKEIYRLVNKFAANPKLKKGFYAYYAGIIRLAKSKKPKKYRADEQTISRLKQVKMV